MALKQQHNKWLSVAQTLLVSAGIGWLCYTAVHQARIDLSTASLVGVVSAIAINLAALLSLSKRLQWTLKVWQIPAATAKVNRINFQSLYYLFLLPFGIGMEAARLYKFNKVLPDTPVRVMAAPVLTDRLLGLCTSLVFGGCLLVWWYAASWIVTSIVVALLLTGVVLFSIGKIFRLPVVTLLIAVVWSFVAHLLTVMAVYLASHAFAIDVSFAVVMLGLSAGVIGAIVPLALGGVGLGDASAAGALTLCGVPPIDAVLVATLAYFSRLMGAVIGGLLELSETRQKT